MFGLALRRSDDWRHRIESVLGALFSIMNFDYQPVLRGALISLRPLRADDFDALFAVASDPLIWEQHPAPRSDEAVFRTFFAQSLASGGALVVIEAGSGQVIGSSRYHDYREEESQVEIGWSFLARRFWGGVYNGELKRLMMEHAFRFVDRVVYRVAVKNFRSQRAVEKIGGVRVGTCTDDGGRESYEYHLSNDVFAKGLGLRKEVEL